MIICNNKGFGTMQSLGSLVFIVIAKSFFLQLCQGQTKNFYIEDRNASNVNKLTEETTAGGDFRYPCYVSVVVYKDPSLKETYRNATVHAVTTKRTDYTSYLGYSSERTDSNGHACLLTLCRERAVLLVESGDVSRGNVERLFAVKKSDQSVPVGYTYNITVRSEEITLNVRSWGVVFGKTGPVYTLDEKDMCKNAGINNYHFSFSFISVPETFVTAIDIGSNFKPQSWYYVDILSETYQVCFMKIKIKIATYQANVSLASYDSGTSDWCGTYSVGPKASPSSPDQETKAACMEFRCAVRDNVGARMNTTVVGHVDGECRIDFNFKVKEVARSNETYFSATIYADNNYGSEEGIYKHKQKEVAKSMCYTGQNDLDPNYEEKMNPNTNYFVVYDCTKPQIPVG